MKYHFKDLLTLLISLFILSSCSNPSLVGLDTDPISGEFIDTINIEASSFLEDSIRSSALSNFPFGYLKDPVIGDTKASIAFAIAPFSGRDARLPANITIDSTVLVIDYGKEFFGDSVASRFQVEVHQLEEPYGFGKDYYSNEKWQINPQLVGSKTISKFAYKDSVSINKNEDGKDTLVKVAPQLRIPLDASKIRKVFDSNLDSSFFANENNFHSHVKGFYISVNSEEQSGLGGIAQLVLNNEANGIEVYYKLPDSTSQLVRRYEISNTQAASAVSHTYSEEVKTELDAGSNDQSTIYIKGLGGLGTSIRFPNLEDLKNKNLVINKAELVMYVDSEATGTVFSEQSPRLTLYRKDIAEQYMPIPDGDTRQSQDGYSLADPRSFGVAYGGFYDKDKKRYSFTLTSYIQDVLLGKIKNKDLYLTTASAGDLSTVPYAPSLRAPSRAILGGGSNEKYQMKLNIYYSLMNE